MFLPYDYAYDYSARRRPPGGAGRRPPRRRRPAATASRPACPPPWIPWTLGPGWRNGTPGGGWRAAPRAGTPERAPRPPHSGRRRGRAPCRRQPAAPRPPTRTTADRSPPPAGDFKRFQKCFTGFNWKIGRVSYLLPISPFRCFATSPFQRQGGQLVTSRLGRSSVADEGSNSHSSRARASHEGLISQAEMLDLTLRGALSLSKATLPVEGYPCRAAGVQESSKTKS
eukprot:630806-Prorocentrum_minimum.AAC.1